MTEVQPNSHRFKAEQKEKEKKPVDKVITGSVKTKKKSSMSKAKDAIISDEANNVGSYLIMDVLVPAMKNAIVDIVTDGVNMIFFGGTSRSSSRSRTSSNVPHISYRDYANKRGGSRFDDRRTPATQSVYNHDDIILDTLKDAEEVLSHMDDLVDTYGRASIADLYDLVGKTCEYTDHDYGWTNVRNAKAVRVREGYILNFPRAIPIK